MAKRKTEKVAEQAEEKSDPKKDLLARIRSRYKIMFDADSENRRLARADIKFVNVPGEQWDASMKKGRGKRPCFEFNKLRITSKRVINDMRANRPAGKVRGVEGGDKKTAEVYEGLLRNIWNISDGDTIIDYAAQYQVDAGFGAWRVDTQYVAEDAFDQELCLKPIPNPFCLWWDPSAKDFLKRDAADWILEDRISKAAYEARWPDAEVVSWDESEFDNDDDWEDDESVRVVEYWYKEPYRKELWQLADGKVVDAGSDEAKLLDPAQIKKKRSAICNRIKMCIASGNAILEQPTDWAGKEHPFVIVFGEFIIIDGKVYWFGLPRFAKDAQRSYNVARTAVSETIGLSPQAKWWATVKQAEGHTAKWNIAHQENLPYMVYNADPAAPGPPIRMSGADVPVALIQESQLASEEIKAVTGIYDASLGAKSNEQSGKAITARQQQGEIATFNYSDNMGKAIRRTWEILIDIVPKIYDTERELRVLGTDGAEDYVKVNTFAAGPNGEQVKIHDLAQGRYDVTVTVGPSWATKRMEAAELYTNMGQAFPPLMQFAGDLVMKSLDAPYSEEIAERIRVMLPPQIQELMSKGKAIPPEAQAVMAQAQQAMQIVQQQSQLVQAAAQEVEQGKAEADKAKTEVQTLIAQLKTEEARFEAKVAKEVARITQMEAQLAVKDAQSQATEGKAEAEQERANLTGEAQQAIAVIQQAAQELTQFAAQIMQQIEQRSAVQNTPKRKQIRAKRVNGELIAQIDEIDEAGATVASREARVRREGGELVGEA